MHIMEKLGGATMPCRGGCGPRDRDVFPLPSVCWAAVGLWAAAAPRVYVLLGGEVLDSSWAEVKAAAVWSGGREGVWRKQGSDLGWIMGLLA